MKIKANTAEFVKARVLKGMSQRQLALESGLSHSYISLLERSVKTVGPQTAKKLSDILEKPLDQLFIIEM
ncbi:helix-turn-helix domain-containing protein [Paenibacillus thalictri]|uniref:XRE family transcriptional regulator n=1 Tax=Paenibacillus thalictri TaxID=2527873 RepID=A0A4Q9DZK1_9BACL|nr:helix-turn-helix transcriptional regulator [Paenibacillus thalictri]TBL81358.1 XRE family transcriptional regulator [Paenibacillus thalictri]